MLRTLRLRLPDRPVFDLTVEAGDDDAADPWTLLNSLADADGRIPLGDRESCAIAEVLDVAIVNTEQTAGPTWERGLQDEDVATAVDENYERPP